MRDLEFTFDWYRSFLRRLQSSGFEFSSYDADITQRDILLRHDIDLSPDRAVEMARIEWDLGISSTYFFLVTSPLYNPIHDRIRDAVAEIAALDHDIGLHFSTHQYWPEDRPPDESSVTAQVLHEQEVLTAVAPDVIPTVSFHIPPDWVLARHFDGFPSTYAPRFFNEISYLADSGQRWREDPPSIPDPSAPLQVLTHPGLWGSTDRSFVERVREAIVESDRRANSYARSRYLESDSGRIRRKGILDA